MNTSASSMPLLVIGNRNYSSWSLRPWLVLRHFNVAFETRMIPLDSDQFQQEIGNYSGARKVPVLRHGRIVVWDSLAISEYANEVWCEGRAWPTDLSARAQARSASAEMHSGFAALRAHCPMNLRLRRSEKKIPEQVQLEINRVQELWTQLRTQHGAGGAFLCGEFSIVDAFFAPVVMRFVSYGIALTPNLQTYVDAMQALPAMQEWTRDAVAEDIQIEKYENIARR